MHDLSALLMFALLALCILAVLLGGARIYRRLNLRDQQSYNSRTCTQYIATRVRQAPNPDGVYVAPFGDGEALCIGQHIRGQAYVTRVYCHDGWLMELFTVDGDGFLPENGEKIMPVEAFSVAVEDGLLTARISVDGVFDQVLLHLRDGGYSDEE